MTDLIWTNTKVKLGDLKAWESNPKFSTKEQAKKILDSWEKFGQVITIAISPARDVYDGHQRLSALLALHGKDYEVDARQSNRLLTEDERKELVITLHASAIGSWDWDKLKSWDATQLKTLGMNSDVLKSWKNDVGKLSQIVESQKPVVVDAEAQIDRADELRVKWGTERGQLWAIGEHRLLCGDSTSADDVARVMGGEMAELAPVDPPYNVGFDYDGETVDDEKTQEKYEMFSRSWFGECQRVSNKQIVTAGCYNLPQWLRWFDSYHVGTWIKSNSMTNGRVSRFWCWEPVIFFGEKFGKKRASDIFDYPIGNQKGVSDHPCPKPLEMWKDLIENYSEPNDIIFDCFAGSGTTLVACQNLNRRGRGIEISPSYCAVILQRMSDAFPNIVIERLP